MRRSRRFQGLKHFTACVNHGVQLRCPLKRERRLAPRPRHGHQKGFSAGQLQGPGLIPPPAALTPLIISCKELHERPTLSPGTMAHLGTWVYRRE